MKGKITLTSDDLDVIRGFYIRAVARGMDLQTLSPMFKLICRLTDEEKEGDGDIDP